MNTLKKLIDRVVFVVVSVALVILLVFWRGCDLKMGIGPGKGQPANTQQHTSTYDEDMPEQKSSFSNVQQIDEMSASSEQPNVVKLFLGRKGISEDQTNWHDMGDFANYIKQLQDKGIKEVHYTLLPDSIERYEEKWADELKKANMRSYIQTDGM